MFKKFLLPLLLLISSVTTCFAAGCNYSAAYTLAGSGSNTGTLLITGTSVNAASTNISCVYNKSLTIPLVTDDITISFSGSSPISIPPASSLPGVPTIASNTPAVASISFLLSAPTTGGGNITYYSVTCVNGSNTFTGTSTYGGNSVSITGLASSTTYSCTAIATNSVGNSSPTSAINVTTLTNPGQILTVVNVGAGVGTITDNTSTINCGTTCSAGYTSGTVVTLTATAAANNVFAGWQGGNCVGVSTCVVTMSAATTVTATFVNNSSFAGTTCAQNSNSIIEIGDNATANLYQYHQFGNYTGSVDVFGSINGTVYMWMNSASCWGAAATNQTDIYTNVSDPQMPRGWTPNDNALQAESTSGYPNNPNFTTLSGMGILISSMSGTNATKVHAHWAMQHPSLANQISTTSTQIPMTSRWDALLDIYIHSVAAGAPNPPGSAFFPTVDVQIYQKLNDQPLLGQLPQYSGYWSGSFLYPSHPFVKTIGGQTFVGTIDAQVSNDSETGAHTISLFVEPTQYTNSSTNGGTTTTLWGLDSATYDIGALLTWLSTANPTDDSGNPITNAAGTASFVTTPIINPAFYLSAITPGFEIDFGSSGQNNWTTTNFWVAVGSEADGPPTP